MGSRAEGHLPWDPPGEGPKNVVNTLRKPVCVFGVRDWEANPAPADVGPIEAPETFGTAARAGGEGPKRRCKKTSEVPGCRKKIGSRRLITTDPDTQTGQGPSHEPTSTRQTGAEVTSAP